MDYENAFLTCRFLASKGGYVVESDRGFPSKAIYADSLGCDLKIYFDGRVGLGWRSGKEFLKVFLGGREVFSYDEGDDEQYFVKGGYWLETINDLELWIDDEVGQENRTLVELCRKESERNRRFLTTYSSYCIDIAKKMVEPRVSPSGGKLYMVNTMVGHDRVSLELSVSRKSPNSVFLHYNKEFVFRYYWDGSGGSVADQTGRYDRGEWEEAIEKLYLELNK